ADGRPGKERCDELETARQRHVLLGVDAEDERPGVVLDRERLQRRRYRGLRPELALEARVVEHHEPALAVERQARAAEQMVEADGERAQAPRGGQPIDAIAVLLTEEQIARLRIDRQAAERGRSWPHRGRDYEPR